MRLTAFGVEFEQVQESGSGHDRQAALHGGDRARSWTGSGKLWRLCRRSLAALGRRIARRCPAAPRLSRLRGLHRPRPSRPEPGECRATAESGSSSDIRSDRRRETIRSAGNGRPGNACRCASRTGAGRAACRRSSRRSQRSQRRRALLTASGHSGTQQIVEMHDANGPIRLHNNECGNLRRVEKFQRLACQLIGADRFR